MKIKASFILTEHGILKEMKSCKRGVAQVGPHDQMEV